MIERDNLDPAVIASRIEPGGIFAERILAHRRIQLGQQRGSRTVVIDDSAVLPDGGIVLITYKNGEVISCILSDNGRQITSNIHSHSPSAKTGIYGFPYEEVTIQTR